MKNLKFILLLFTVTALMNSCKKDDKGQWIQYYRNKTGVGYVFYKYPDGTLIPFNGSIGPFDGKHEIKVENIAGGKIDGIFGDISYEHDDYFTIDKNGKYEYKFVKKIDGRKCTKYEHYLCFKDGFTAEEGFGSVEIMIGDVSILQHGVFSLRNEELEKYGKIVNFDTIFVCIKIDNK